MCKFASAETDVMHGCFDGNITIKRRIKMSGKVEDIEIIEKNMRIEIKEMVKSITFSIITSFPQLTKSLSLSNQLPFI